MPVNLPEKRMVSSEEIQEAFRRLGFEVEVDAEKDPSTFLVICKPDDLARLADKIDAIRAGTDTSEKQNPISANKKRANETPLY